MSANKDFRIDNLRAFAIILVVFGHSIILYSTNWNLYTSINHSDSLNLIKMVIDVLQMPIFISLSGYLFIKTYKKHKFITLLKKKSIRLLVPYLTIFCFWMLPIRLLVGYAGYQQRNIWDILLQNLLLGQDNGHLWFLPFLFWTFIIYFCINKILSSMHVADQVSVIINFALGIVAYCEWWRIPENMIYGTVLRSVGLYYIWFCFGAVLGMFSRCISCLKPYKIIILFLGVICIVTYIAGLQPFTMLTKLFSVFSTYVAVSDQENKISTFLSRNSFGIYLFHSPLIYIVFKYGCDWRPIWVVLCNFVIFGSLATILTILCRKSPLKMIIGE